MGREIKLRVAIVYTHFPHYRSAIFKKLYDSKCVNFDFFFSDATDKTILDGRYAELEADVVPILNCGEVKIQYGLLARLRKYDVVIFLGNPYIISYWFYTVVLRFFSGTKVFFWTHGWLQKDRWPKSMIRNTFYRLANGLLLYGNRAKEFGRSCGFSDDNLHVIYNSLDYSAQKKIRGELDISTLGEPKYFIFLGRLVSAARLDVAIRALSRIQEKYGSSLTLVVVGDGPLMEELISLSIQCDVDVIFKGAIYDERELSQLFSKSRALVSPGKVGLAAMHSLGYGIPVLTHGNLDKQMPEVEALESNVSGGFFLQGSSDSLADLMFDWWNRAKTDNERFKCIRAIELNYTAERQEQYILDALNTLKIIQKV
jgi:glycosyltransferase involved in cell wall biosynthesis